MPETDTLLKPMNPVEYWDNVAAWFIEHQSDFESRDEIIGEFLERAGDMPFVLDVGCGYGRALPALLDFINEYPMFGYIGVDFSKQMLEEARKRYPDADFREGFIGSLSSGKVVPEVCDAFMAFCSLGMIRHENMTAALKDIRKCLRQGAVGLISIEYGTETLTATTDSGHGIPEGMKSSIYPWTPLEFIPRLVEAGFGECETSLPCPCHFITYVKAV